MTGKPNDQELKSIVSSEFIKTETYIGVNEREIQQLADSADVEIIEKKPHPNPQYITIDSDDNEVTEDTFDVKINRAQ